MSAAPELFVGPAFVGWRSWRIMAFDRLGEEPSVRLCASGRNGLPKVWEPGKAMHAVCGKFETTHEAPWMDCHCGFHAYSDRDKALDHFDSFMENNGDDVAGWAFGRVSLWGRTVEHEDGWRSEWAYPLDLTVYAPDAVADTIGELYGVEVQVGELEPADDDEHEAEVADEPAVPSRSGPKAKLLRTLDDLDERLDRIGEAVKLAALTGIVDRNSESWIGLDISTTGMRLDTLRREIRKLTSLDDVRKGTVIELAEIARDMEEKLLPRLEKAEAQVVAHQARKERERERKRELEERPFVYVRDKTDAQIVAAVGKGVRQWAAFRKQQGRGLEPSLGPSASCVCDVLAGGKGPGTRHDFQVRQGDVIRIGQKLARLAREGRIVVVSRSYEPKRYALPEHARA